jgi:hypothetical protein
MGRFSVLWGSIASTIASTIDGVKPMTEELGTRPRRTFPLRTTVIAVALMGAGGAIGATAARMAGPSIEMAPVRPVAIASLSGDGLVTVKGQVGDVFGPMFVLADGSGRTLVDGGPHGVEAGLIRSGAPVTIQGWYRRGIVRASFLVGADGKVTALGPMHGPHDRPGHRHGDHDDPPQRGAETAPPAVERGAAPTDAPQPVGNAG